MLTGMVRLTTRSDILVPTITLAFCILAGGILLSAADSPATRGFLWIVFAGIFLIVLLSVLRGLSGRARRLLSGHCPHPLCHGVVHHSELVPRGFVVCPTCKNRWPDINGIQFKLTVRQ